MRGEGVKQDSKIAKQYFESVLRKYRGRERYRASPVVAALFGLGTMYERGLGVKQNNSKALKFYKKIIMYSGGVGRPLRVFALIGSPLIIPLFLDLVKTVRLQNLRESDFGSAPILKSLVAETLYNMGIIYQKSNSDHKARKFLQKAVDFGNEDAMKALRNMEH
ncbi:hypothetical protein [Helicobacter bizzozeronii]|uniref:hypothetical protein n=1 Tax=Helicobacter bizzozeronii TaxID=56877 RepID=UPI0025561DBE|nr:hypothetical protein [Helicobacter bizzozeronii]